jgi:hypothetical protein
MKIEEVCGYDTHEIGTIEWRSHESQLRPSMYFEYFFGKIET